MAVRDIDQKTLYYIGQMLTGFGLIWSDGKINLEATPGTGTVTSVSAGPGLSISGDPNVNPTVNIATGYQLINNAAQNFSGVKNFIDGIKIGTAGQITYNGRFFVNGSFLPDAAGYDLGSSGFKWNNLYLYGNLSDGTRSIKVADIQEKIQIVDLTRLNQGGSN